MAGRNRMPRYPMPSGSRGFPEDPRSMIMNHGPGPLRRHPAALEDELIIQREEIHRIRSENQKLVDNNIILHRELATAKDEMNQASKIIPKLRAEKESQVRELIQRGFKLESELRAAEPLKLEVLQLRGEAQKLSAIRQDLSAKVQGLTQDLTRLKAENKQLLVLKADIDGLRQELTRAREAIEFEKKANIEQMEQKQAMEKNLVTMAREVEKLRGALNSEKIAGGLGGPYGMSKGSTELRYRADSLRDRYSNTWGLYDTQGAARR